MKPLQWSISALNSYETCPRRHYLTKVAKTVVEAPSEAINWGRQVHKAFELRLKNEAPLPPFLDNYEGMVSRILARPGKRLVEGKLCVDANFQPTDWRSRSAWCRGIVDIGIIGTKSAFVGDWKTGKWKPESDQMELMAGLTFSHYPFVQEATTTFIWLKDKKIDTHVFTRTQLGEIWAKFLPRVHKLERALIEDRWPPRPSGLCDKWCPVTRDKCEHGRLR